MKKGIIKTVCFILLAFMVVSLWGCQAKQTETPEEVTQAAEPAAQKVNPLEKLSALTFNDEELGIAGKYKSLVDITDGSVDPALIGSWTTADGMNSYIYNEDGTAKSVTDSYGENAFDFTCIKAGDVSIVCNESEMLGDVEEGTTALSYFAYTIENDALYMVAVEERNPDFTSSQSALLALYRNDAYGNIVDSLAANLYDISAFDGTWTSDKGDITIENGKLTSGGESWDVRLNDINQLVAEKDGGHTVYSTSVSVLIEHDGD
ncbi:MAG: hypothetical protein IKH13_03320, partial [Clostridia bacterium]|nr:hypothetical protein [Clostridia bacterium]